MDNNNINRLRQEFSEQIHDLVDDFSHRLERLNPEYHRRKERESRSAGLAVLLAVLIGGALLAWRGLNGPLGEAITKREDESDFEPTRRNSSTADGR